MRRELVNSHPSGQCCFDVLDGVGEAEGQFLNGASPGLANMVSAYADGMPARHILSTVLDQVNSNSERIARRVDVGVPCDVLFQNVVLSGSSQLLLGNALFHAYSRVES